MKTGSSFSSLLLSGLPQLTGKDDEIVAFGAIAPRLLYAGGGPALVPPEPPVVSYPRTIKTYERSPCKRLQGGKNEHGNAFGLRSPHRLLRP
ncbi:hypothetical protein H6F75_25600 [Nodosilinea sp. FACHB-131]|uniref:hypothetical protein n=1 Tax=Cyanophyceae TaxID=3028117 RepID=UPI0016857E07|nr:hypothetical protein [Nodosilinea sp. FACHB-131]MBD1876866.1 hypothetical protein [Nodosilinea sp. FACHB-131]